MTLRSGIQLQAFIDELRQKPVYKNKNNIMSGWKWGCPSEPTSFFGDNGWKVLSHPTWNAAAEAFGFMPEKALSRAQEAQNNSRPTGGVQYVTAILDKLT